MVSVEYSEALVEVLEILNNTDTNLVNKIPKKFIEFMKNNASQTYTIKIDNRQNLKELQLKETTKNILAIIYRNYWCTPEQKIEYDKILQENEDKYQEELREKYNPDNIFKNNNVSKTVQIQENNNTQLIEYKEENIFKKIFNKIKSFFKLP